MSNKKATFSLEVFIKILFTVIIITFFFIFGSDLYAAVTGNRANQDTVKNFEALADNLQFMMDKQAPFDSQSMVLFIEKNHYIFGFINAQTLADYGKNTGDYPNECNNNPCLCLYKKLKNFPQSPVKCKQFDNQVIFHGTLMQNTISEPVYEQNPYTQNYLGGVTNDLSIPKQQEYLYSGYPGDLMLDYYHLELTSSDKLVQNLYIEKFVNNGRIHLLVTPYLNQDQIDKRNGLLAGCPQSSDDGCKGVQVNSWVDVVNFCHYDLDAQRCILKSGVERCPPDTRISGSCVCGVEFVNMSEDIRERYCHERGFDGRIFLLEFDCVSLAQNSQNQGIGGCASYCNERPESASNCDPDEQANCKLNPCGFTSQFSGNVCKVTPVGSRFECKPDNVQ